MSINPSWIVVSLLALALGGGGLWLYYDMSDTEVRLENYGDTAMQVRPSVAATEHAGQFAADLKNLRLLVDDVRAQVQRTEANLRVELASSYQRLALLEREQGTLKSMLSNDPGSVLKSNLSQVVELARLAARNSDPESEQPLLRTIEWLSDYPEHASLAVMLNRHLSELRQWREQRDQLLLDLDTLRDHLGKIPLLPAALNPEPTDQNRDWLQVLSGAFDGLFRLRRVDTPSPVEINALALELYRAQAYALVDMLETAVQLGAPEHFERSRNNLKDVLNRFPPSPEHEQSQQFLSELQLAKVPKLNLDAQADGTRRAP